VAFQYLRVVLKLVHFINRLVSSQANVRYVDRMPVEVKKQYPELSAYNLVEPDILDDGETLSSISDDSVDFGYNHMIEH